MNEPDPIKAYHVQLSEADQVICNLLRSEIDAALTEATSKVWHGHPVWFLDGNPVVGYSRRKAGICLLFWSGQDFDEQGLKPEGKFRAAEALFDDAVRIDISALGRWLQKARAIQWDYKNIVKRRGVLERLT